MSDVFHVGALSSHPSGGYQNFVPAFNGSGVVSFGGETVRTDVVTPFTFGNSAPPPIILPFDCHRLAASPQTLLLAGLWPKDSTMQLLLQTIIDIAASMNLDTVLTAPTAVALAGCSFRMAAFLHESSGAGKFASSARDWTRVPLNLDFATLHTDAMQQFKQHGWNNATAAATSLPRAILDQWLQIGKESQPALLLLASSSADSEEAADQFACGVVGKRWIEILLQGMHMAARATGSPLLSLSMLEALVSPQENTPNKSGFALGAFVHHMSLVLQCDLTPNLDLITSFTKEKLQRNSPLYFFRGVPVSSYDYYVYFSHAATAEDEATARILDAKSWYHQPQLVKLIAQQLVNGTRQLHISDQLLDKMGIRICRLQGLLPLLLLTQEHQQHRSKLVQKLHLKVTDAQARDWNMFLEFDGRGGTLIEAMPESAFGGSRLTTEPLAQLKMLVDGTPRVNGTAGVNALNSNTLPVGAWTEFQIQLSQTQLQIIDHLKQANELTRSLWSGATEAEVTTQHLAAKPKPLSQHITAFPNNSKLVQSQDIPSCFATVQEYFGRSKFEGSRGFNHVDLQKTIVEWRAHEFEKIMLQTVPLMDHVRWGMQRYANLHPEAARRNFQSSVIDAAMQANGMPLLPKVLVDIIVDYHYVDVLPYITLEEQEALAKGESSSSISK